MFFINFFILNHIVEYFITVKGLTRICDTTHTGHHTQNIVRVSIHSDLGSVGSNNSSRRKDKLEGSIVDSGEVTRAAGLMLLRSEQQPEPERRGRRFNRGPRGPASSSPAIARLSP